MRKRGRVGRSYIGRRLIAPIEAELERSENLDELPLEAPPIRITLRDIVELGSK